ncbi:hypothetical protein DX933_00485 [Ornithinibacillus gellani]|uniref:cell wall-active antibiotics response protein LiaF n=1 Tax=Ornithinibacillus gellani TaxID=2293253 RepID=UPI000F4A76B9|nr:cell wall-active antibiotics response protein LiaF [Ornithinibacillus gellani]TQS76616.1 hypothetical protein DX933_00485 [Ornithinibacillus gellani]
MNSFLRYLLAAAFVTFGAMLILENLGMGSLNFKNAWGYFYPALFIIFGLKWMADRFRYRGGSWVGGSFLFIFGSLLMLDRFDVLNFVFGDIFKLWPLLIIYVGFSIIGFSSRSKRYKTYVNKNYDDIKDAKYKETVSKFSIGDYEYNKPNWKVEPMYLNTMAGDFYLDFTKAFIPETTTPITISALAGDVHIIIPESVEFRVHASVKAGDIKIVGEEVDGINRSLEFETNDYTNAERRLDFRLKLKAGSIRVDYV